MNDFKISQFYVSDEFDIHNESELGHFQTLKYIYSDSDVEVTMNINHECQYATATIHYHVDNDASGQQIMNAVDRVAEEFAVNEPIVCFQLIGRLLARLGSTSKARC